VSCGRPAVGEYCIASAVASGPSATFEPSFSVSWTSLIGNMAGEGMPLPREIIPGWRMSGTNARIGEGCRRREALLMNEWQARTAMVAGGARRC